MTTLFPPFDGALDLWRFRGDACLAKRVCAGELNDVASRPVVIGFALLLGLSLFFGLAV
jgi:hypothetical protein